MIGGILGGIGKILGGAGAIAGHALSGIGALGGQIIGGADKIFSQLPAVSESVMPIADLWVEIQKNRTAEHIAGKQYSLAQQQIQAQKDVALQNALLANQPVQIQTEPIPAEPARPGQIIMPAQPQPAEKQSDIFLFLILGIFGFLLLTKK